jgi:hypothetical protein
LFHSSDDVIGYSFQAIAAIQKNQEELSKLAQDKKAAEEERQANVKKAQEVLKAKQDLLGKLIEEQKKLITRIEEKKATMSATEKSSLMGLLKSITASIETARTDMKKAVEAASAAAAVAAASAGVVPTSPASGRTKAEVEKELLDAEMELYQAQQDSAVNTCPSVDANVSELQKKVNALRMEAGRLGVAKPIRGGLLSPRGFYRGRGRGSFFVPRARGRGRGRGLRGRGGRIAYVGTSVDRRPTRLLVTGFEAEQKQELIDHFLVSCQYYLNWFP